MLTTPKHQLPYPEGNDPADGPTQIGALATATEAALNTVRVPIGAPISWLVDTLPAGYLEFDGQVIVQATYPQLFSLYGGNLPDLRGRFLFGQTANFAPRSKGGEVNHPLLTEEMPSHSHSANGSSSSQGNHNHGGEVTTDYPDHGHAVPQYLGYDGQAHGIKFQQGVNTVHWAQTQSGTYGAGSRHTHGVYPDGGHAHTIWVSLGAAGGNPARPGEVTPHNNMPPYFVCRWITLAG